MSELPGLYRRRAFLATLAQAGCASALAPLGRAAQWLNENTVTISILHTTDIHGHILPTEDYAGNKDLGGLARCVTQIRRWRRKNPNTILLDVGDVYQGTEVALRTCGQLMIDLFNHLRYDAWVVGNHEFDWGIDPFLRAVTQSKMPVLAANVSVEGRAAGQLSDRHNPLGKIQPYLLKRIDGIKIAVIGVTTPGMPYWFRPEFIRGLEFHYPVDSVRRAMQRARHDGAHAIVLAGHMGLKSRTGGDDFANNVTALTAEFPETAVFIGGHTHQNIRGRLINNVLLTQADHFGIHVGRVDLTFDRASRQLVHRQATCELMDDRFKLDRHVLSRAKGYLNVSETALAEPIGELLEPFSVVSQPGEPSDLEWLISTALIESMRERDVAVAGALHGVFDLKKEIPAGPKTVNDVWKMIPYENYIVTAELTADDLKTVLDETFSTYERRNLIGFQVEIEGTGLNRVVRAIRDERGQPLERGRRYTIACNTFDSRSAGHRFMKLRALLEQPESNCRLHDVQTRDALIEYFQRHRQVRRRPASSLPVAA